jgi:hypothetical protein
MKEEWNRQKENGVPFFVENKSVKYGIDNLNLRWQQLLEYEKDYDKQFAAEGGDSAHAHNGNGHLSATAAAAAALLWEALLWEALSHSERRI